MILLTNKIIKTTKMVNTVPAEESGDITQLMDIQIQLANLPKIDMMNHEEVSQRLNDYFMIYALHNEKPTVAGMALALNGHHRVWLSDAINHRYTGGDPYYAKICPEGLEEIKKAYIMLESMWESYMSSGKVNPVTGIFMAKNHYGYVDKVEHSVATTVKQEDNYSIDDIKQRYIATDSK